MPIGVLATCRGMHSNQVTYQLTWSEMLAHLSAMPPISISIQPFKVEVLIHEDMFSVCPNIM